MLASSFQAVAQVLPSALLPVLETYQVCPLAGAVVVADGEGEAVVVLAVGLGEGLGDVVLEVVGVGVGPVTLRSDRLKSSTVRVPTDCSAMPKLSRAASLGADGVLNEEDFHDEDAARMGPLAQYFQAPVVLLW
jgi:hypothetical protein